MATVRLLGENISHSASPAMHAAAFSALGVDHRYELADVPATDLPAAVAALREADVLGANVTVPHKSAVMPLLDEIDPAARIAGAVNTIVNREGRLIGSNTDVPAIADEIGRWGRAPHKAAILGAGGAAHAVALALQRLGCREVALVMRVTWSELPALLANADLLVNATPVGTNSDESPVGQGLLHPGLGVLDLVYRPSPTRLVGDARDCGLHARAGAGVLLGQGWRSLAAWLGQPVSENAKQQMAAALRTELGVGADV